MPVFLWGGDLRKKFNTLTVFYDKQILFYRTKRTFIVCQYEELMSKGNFAREDAVTMLTAHEGNVDAAFQV